MSKKLLVVWATALALLAGFTLWTYYDRPLPFSEPEAPSDAIRAEDLNIQTDNPQRAGQNITN